MRQKSNKTRARCRGEIINSIKGKTVENELLAVGSDRMTDRQTDRQTHPLIELRIKRHSNRRGHPDNPYQGII